jgi:hypothetical protein
MQQFNQSLYEQQCRKLEFTTNQGSSVSSSFFSFFISSTFLLYFSPLSSPLFFSSTFFISFFLISILLSLLSVFLSLVFLFISCRLSFSFLPFHFSFPSPFIFFLCFFTSSCFPSSVYFFILPIHSWANILLHKILVNPLKPKLVQIIFMHSDLTAKKTQLFTITKINWLTVFKEIIAVYSESHKNPYIQNE